ncbi:cholesterol 7-desaturase nvd 1-like isoform X2 [Chironomus tepperi]
MGANLGVGGIVNGECIKCSFHHWNFNGKDGSLVDVPYSDDIEGIKKFAQLKKWTSREVNEQIFVWYHAENEDPWEIEAIPSIESGEMVQHGSLEFEIYAHIQDIVENGADFAHFDPIHSPNMFAGSDITTLHNSKLSIGTHEFEAKFTPSEEKKHSTYISLSQSMRIFGMSFFHLNADIYQIGPGYAVVKMKTVFGESLAVQTGTPLEPLKQKFKIYLYGSRLAGLYVKLILFAQIVNVGRDVMVWNSKTFVRSPLLPKEEKQIRMYRNWFSQFYSQNSKSYQDISNNLNW